MRARHDLLGCNNRMRQTASEFREAVGIVLEHWKDARGARFAKEDLKDIDKVIDQVSIYLQKASETIAKFDRQLRDENEA